MRNTHVKPIGFFWFHTSRDERIPAESFPPIRQSSEDADEWSRISCDPATWTVVLDEESFPIENRQTFKAFELVVNARGDCVPSPDIRAKVPGCHSRLRRVFDRLPPELSPIIVGTRGHNGGFSAKLPPKKKRHKGTLKVHKGT
jgi:hypothetical protein